MNTPKKMPKAAAGPSHEEANKLLWYCNAGRFDVAQKLAERLTQRFPAHPFAWMILGQILAQTGAFAAALDPLQRAARLVPDDADIHNDLGIILNALGRPADAETHQREALRLAPGTAIAHNNLGNTLLAQGRLAEAETHYREALRLDPALTQAQHNLGNLLFDQGRLDDAESCYRAVVRLQPSADAFNSLGVACLGRGRVTDAVSAFRDAIERDAAHRGAQTNIGLALFRLGDIDNALAVAQRLLDAGDSPEARALFVDCLRRAAPSAFDAALAGRMCRALREPWGRPTDLMGAACRLVRLDPSLQALFAAAADAGSALPEDLGAALVSGASAPLLLEFLCSAPVSDRDFERLLTTSRRHFLLDAREAADTPPTPFECALARQCFINEYVFFQTPEERAALAGLRDDIRRALDQGQAIPARRLVALGCYAPLFTLDADDALLQRDWPDDVQAVLTEQLREPREEHALRAALPTLTAIDDETSLAVQGQYEENPYPRWTRVPARQAEGSVNAYLRRRFPLARIDALPEDRPLDVLVAGCGTGQDPIAAAQAYAGVRILAIDLSLASLGYAKRKTAALAIDTIEYARADILKLGTLGRDFDVIESTGVLHHLADPYAGWKVLLGLLRPKGVMRLGFYSALARREIVRIRGEIAARGLGGSADDIRNFRPEIADLEGTVTSADFYSTSACRDLLFHVQEHQMTLDAIAGFLKEQELGFLGFDIDATVIDGYRARFGNDPAATDLGQWQRYEAENPDIFRGMYQFWIQKT